MMDEKHRSYAGEEDNKTSSSSLGAFKSDEYDFDGEGDDLLYGTLSCVCRVLEGSAFVVVCHGLACFSMGRPSLSTPIGRGA